MRDLHPEMANRARNLDLGTLDLDATLESRGHAAVARDFLRRIGAAEGHVARCANELMVYAPSKGVWEALSDLALQGELLRYRGCSYLDSKGKQQRAYMSNGFLLSTIKSALHDDSVQPESYFEDAPDGVQFQNGFLCFRDGKAELLPTSPENRSFWSKPYDYDPDAECPKWKAFLGDLFWGDADAQEKIAKLQRFLGASVFGRAPHYGRCLVLVGEGANGKSTLVDAIRRTLFAEGRDAALSPRQCKSEYFRVLLSQADINMVAGIPERREIESESFQAIVAGEETSARQPYGRGYRFRPRCGHIFMGARLPEGFGSNFDYRRYLDVIEFHRCFENAPERRRIDKLVDDLATEAPGIMAWAVRGAEELEKAKGN